MKPQKQLGLAPIEIILIIVGVLIICGGGYYLFTQKLTQSQQSISTPQPTTQDETADWQIYRNEKYGFEIKYPNDWQLEDLSNESISYCNITINGPESNTSYSGLYSLCLAIDENTDKLSVQDIDVVQRYTKKEQFLFNGLEAVEFNGVFAFDRSEDIIYIISKEYIFAFSFPSAEENSNFSEPVKNNTIARKILSTFKFIE